MGLVFSTEGGAGNEAVVTSRQLFDESNARTNPEEDAQASGWQASQSGALGAQASVIQDKANGADADADASARSFPLGAAWPASSASSSLLPPVVSSSSSNTTTPDAPDAPVALVHDADTMDAHARQGHPEHPDRTRALAALLAERGLLARCWRLRQRPATDAELTAVHGAGHVRRVETLWQEASEAAAAAAVAAEAAAAAAAAAAASAAAEPSSFGAVTTAAAAAATPPPPPPPLLAHLTDGAGRPLRDADGRPARLCPRDGLVLLGGDIFVGPATAAAARMAAGCAAEAALAVARWEPPPSPGPSGRDAVLSSNNGVPRAFAAVRPPGHHASSDRAGGFCFFNACAVAARAALSAPGGRVRRVLIFDPDVHHGNGTQDVFYGDERVLTVSMHRRDGRFFPDGSGGAFEVGSAAAAAGGAAAAAATAAATAAARGGGNNATTTTVSTHTSAAGRNVNIPWRSRGAGDADVLAAMDLVVEPIARAFSPDLVVLAAGFDAARGDPLGGCLCSPPLYGALVRRLLLRVPSARGRMVAVLEGGYSPRVVAACAAEVVEAMLTTPLVGAGAGAADAVAATTAAAAAAQGGRADAATQQEQAEQRLPALERDAGLPASAMLRSTPAALCEAYCAQHPYWGEALDAPLRQQQQQQQQLGPAAATAVAAASEPLASAALAADDAPPPPPTLLPEGTPPPPTSQPAALPLFRQRVAELAAQYQLEALSLWGAGGGNGGPAAAALRGLESLDAAALSSPRAVRKTTAAARRLGTSGGGGSGPPSPRAAPGSPSRAGRGEAGSLSGGAPAQGSSLSSSSSGAAAKVRAAPKAPPRGEGRAGGSQQRPGERRSASVVTRMEF